MSTMFTKAVRSQRKLRAAIDGPSGGGKTYSTLRLAFAMKAAGLCSRIAWIDTENNSASLYAGESPDGIPWEFETLNLKQYNPDQFTNAIKTAAKEGFDLVGVDSLSHAWVGQGGALDLVDSKGGNKFTAWKDVTPLHRAMIDAIIQSPIHVLATMRSKTEYVLEEDEKGKKVPRKIGVAPVQRDGMEYEFDLYCSMDWSNQLKVTKSRCSPMNAATAIKPGPAFWTPLFDWLKSAADVPAPAPVEMAKPGERKKPASEVLGVLYQQVKDATTIDELKAAGQAMRKALDAGDVGAAEDAIFKPHYQEKKAALEAAAVGGSKS